MGRRMRIFESWALSIGIAWMIIMATLAVTHAVVVPPPPAPPKWQMSKQPTSTAVQAFLGTMTANQSGAAKIAIGGDFYYVWYPEK